MYIINVYKYTYTFFCILGTSGKKKAKGGKKVHSRGEWSGSNSVDNTSTSTNTTPSQNRRSRFKNKRDSQQQHQQPETIEIMDDDDDDVPDDVDDDHDHNDEIDGSTNGDSGNLGGSNATKCGRSAESENLPPLHLRGDTTQRVSCAVHMHACYQKEQHLKTKQSQPEKRISLSVCSSFFWINGGNAISSLAIFFLIYTFCWLSSMIF